MSRKNTRSRDGCWTCRERKKKCDAGGVPCGNCTRLNLECKSEFRLVWEDDSKRAAMRRRGPRRKTLTPCAAIRSSDEDQDDSANAPRPFCPSRSEANTPGKLTRFPQAFQFPRPLDSLDVILLENYVQRFSRTYPTQTGPKNPFLSVFIPLALRSEVVLDSLLCLSSAQQWNDTIEGMTVKRLALRQRALRGCMSVLGQDQARKAQPHRVTAELPQFILLASASLFLLHEKVMGELSWRPHIEYMNQFFESWTSLKESNVSTSESEALEFFHTTLIYNDLVQSTSSRGPIMSRFYTSGSHLGGCSEDVDGCKPDIISQRYYFPRLVARMSVGDSSVTELEIRRWDGSLNWLPSFALNSSQQSSHYLTAVPAEGADQEVISDLYRLAASVYRRQCAARHSCVPFDTAEGISSQEIASQALLRMASLQEGSTYENALLWPMAIVANVLTSKQALERVIVLQRLQSLEGRFGMRQFRRAQEVLVQNWMVQDCGGSTDALSTGTVLLG